MPIHTTSSRRPRARRGSALAFVAALLPMLFGAGGRVALAQAPAPAEHDDDAFDLMNVLARHKLHDLDEERWNLYGQTTAIGNWKPKFNSPYENLNGSGNSLIGSAEGSYTTSVTLFGGVKLWHGSGLYFVPEMIAERPLSGLHGLGGAIQNFELQKTGSPTPQLYRSQTFLRQFVDIGGKKVKLDSDPLQLERKTTSHRLVLTVGNFTALGVFDRNSVTWDSRQTFVNMAFMTHASWDFTADARGYSWGGAAELIWDDWAVRFGRLTPPKDPNQLETDFRLYKFYGDDLEVEHDHKLLGQDGAVRILGYRNRVDTGSFNDAINVFQKNRTLNAANCGNLFNYGSTNANAPDLCWVRHANVKMGIGINVEQHVWDDAGVFFRAMYSDGRTEVDAFNAADRSVSIGAVAKGSKWHRSFDVAGVGFGASWISGAHQRYLEMGGVDGFIGDGKLSPGAETVSEVFYSVNVLRAIWFTADYQHITNPGYNTDRGPVEVVSGRVHAEF